MTSFQPLYSVKSTRPPEFSVQNQVRVIFPPATKGNNPFLQVKALSFRKIVASWAMELYWMRDDWTGFANALNSTLSRSVVLLVSSILWRHCCLMLQGKGESDAFIQVSQEKRKKKTETECLPWLKGLVRVCSSILRARLYKWVWAHALLFF